MSKGVRDSTDSYAAMFLLAVEEMHKVDKSSDKVKHLEHSIRHSITAINSTMDDGLTWAKSTYQVR